MQSLPPGLRLVGSVYHLRIGIPDKVRHLWPRQNNGKPATDAFRASLKTADRAEAITLAHKLIAEHRTKFQALEDAARPAPFVALTPALVAYIADETRRMVLQADENATFYSDNQEQRELARSAFASARQRSLEVLQGGDLEIAQQYAERIAQTLGVKVDWSTPEGRRCLIQTARVLVAAWLDIEQRQQGKPIDTPPPPEPPVVHTEPPEPAEPPKTLRDVVPSWIARNAPKDNAVGRTQKALALFEQAVGSVPLVELTKAKGAAFVDFLLDPARGWSRKTAANHAACITALANVAVKCDLMERNPLDLAFDKTVGAKTREPWTDDEMRRMYGHSLFSARMAEVPHWQDVEPSDGRALLLLLLHTGARIGEIAQLRKEDFQTRNGITAIRITAEAGTVKTQESERIVPLAAHLLAEPWFAQWLEGVLGGVGPAFPSACGRARGPGDTMGQWFRQFRKDAALPEGALEGSHKFRHWLRSSLAEKHVGEATMDSITGHSAQGSAGRKTYTAAASLPTMVEALDRIDWPRVSQ
ncbi:tyrosine-type recombinase/integrase [Burkholderia vietnamiensis]|uniref:tyrosine-type recombinase/integrase n=1 Tax=Burkholderia vietnamiensis TaxID=60552 RepID=UPI001CF5A3E2|nr:tyrosine-type recombinase/integrase [Burkholderia vietnamiensis]MCA8146777.1 tyrosine-type recombinase/integrase [Burkholderia vietnamiensis]